ncbi:MAG: DNA polymerase III subunit gamma/tau [Thermoleophilia bacterium]|nr:DNA polymerase III subunit gamma/tau [Thermoleophilia bacterium]MDH3725561.1 DNA polymerase III subunit gamma/tau [Thermoleophilia bacterium]
MIDRGASLYNRHRPSRFDDLVGQDHVARALSNALTRGEPPRAFLFSGPRGTGKTTTARILARCLTCQRSDGPTAKPCMECDACLKCGRPDWLDVVEVDAASSARRIDEMRDWLESVRYPPVACRYRVTIMDEAHQIQKDAASALLKTLEEPPPHLVVILCTTHPWEIIGTIRSRLQHYVLRRPSVIDLTAVLRKVSDSEGISASPEALDLIARASDGSYRDGLGLLEMLSAFGEGSIEADDVISLHGGVSRASVVSLVDAMARGDVASAFAELEGALDAGADPDQLMRALVTHLRYILLLQQGAEPREEWGLGEQDLAAITAQAQNLSDQQVITGLDLMADAQVRIRHGGADSRLQLELVAAKLGRPGTRPALAVAPGAGTATTQAPRPSPANEPPTSPEPDPPERPVAAAAETPQTPAEDPPRVEEPPDHTKAEATQHAPPAAASEDRSPSWPAVMAELKDVAPSVAGILEGGRISDVADGAVTIELPNETRRTMLERGDNAGRVAQVLQRHAGGPLEVRYEVSSSQEEAHPAADPGAPLADDELHDRLKSMFNATPET